MNTQADAMIDTSRLGMDVLGVDVPGFEVDVLANVLQQGKPLRDLFSKLPALSVCDRTEGREILQKLAGWIKKDPTSTQALQTLLETLYQQLRKTPESIASTTIADELKQLISWAVAIRGYSQFLEKTEAEWQSLHLNNSYNIADIEVLLGLITETPSEVQLNAQNPNETSLHPKSAKNITALVNHQLIGSFEYGHEEAETSDAQALANQLIPILTGGSTLGQPFNWKQVDCPNNKTLVDFVMDDIHMRRDDRKENFYLYFDEAQVNDYLLALIHKIIAIFNTCSPSEAVALPLVRVSEYIIGSEHLVFNGSIFKRFVNLLKELYKIEQSLCQTSQEHNSPPPKDETKMNIKLFVSYSHEDEALAAKLLKKLKTKLKNVAGYQFTIWDDRELLAGEDWFAIIQEQLDACDFGLLLMSDEFLASDFIKEHELPDLIKHDKVLPIELNRIDYEDTDFQGLKDKQIFSLNRKTSFAYCQHDNEVNDFCIELKKHITRRAKPLENKEKA